MSTKQTSDATIDSWERHIAKGITKLRESYILRDSWLNGRVHVLPSVAPQFEPVPTVIGIPVHQLLLPTNGTARMVTRTHSGQCIADIAFATKQMVINTPDHMAQKGFITWDSEISIINVLLEPDLLRSACQSADIAYEDIEFVNVYPVTDRFLEQLVRMLGAEADKNAPFGRLYAEQLMQTAAVHMLHNYSVCNRQVKHYQDKLEEWIIQRIDEYIDANLAEDIGLADLAGLASLSEYHFSRQFKRTTGLPPHQYVIQRRIERAKHLLQETNSPIQLVAHLVGYGSQSHFSQIFKQKVGLTPSQYRQ